MDIQIHSHRSRIRHPLLFFLIIIILTSLACNDDFEDWLSENQTHDEPDTNITQTMTGEIVGKADNIWTLPGQTLTCTDNDANYQLTISSEMQPPQDAHINNSFPKGLNYFRLDVYAVLRLADSGACLIRDPSQDRVHVLIEGGFDQNSSQFTIMSCSYGELTDVGGIYYSGPNKFHGKIECSTGSQNKAIFDFADLEVK